MDADELRRQDEAIIKRAEGISTPMKVGRPGDFVIRVDGRVREPVVRELCLLTGYRQSASDGPSVLCRDDYPSIRITTGERRKTALEAIAFRVDDIDDAVRHCRDSPVPAIITPDGTAILTGPSDLTGIAVHFTAADAGSSADGQRPSLSRPFHARIGPPDHITIRVRAEQRPDAVLELIRLTGAVFTGSEYVVPFRSVNSVLMLPGTGFAINVVSGTRPFIPEKGITEPFLSRFGAGVHHIGFLADGIRELVAEMEEDGIPFSLPLTGSEGEGILQAMTTRSEYTGLIIEYLQRYGSFSGFFAPSMTVRPSGPSSPPPSPEPQDP
ncbi:hypothetical protein [Methanofollis fontis]|uniref:VOC domain-containing protein n=1 Tax=Methanofollis fontis TaxID=2052832 RepID=A0A483CPD6_9EURY|nr:hypothetical protein [Methanofollis fontis]TAJ44870.1 hypothetical protein CUJ86_06190 [Methanofollis fontis]